ncbi:phytoene desaturase family protein [Candidatus Methylocalor cossyra]
MSGASCDILVIGGGHNGLVCACYLARAGLRVRVLERRPLVGGAAVTEEFHPGFRNSVASYTVSLLHPKVMRDLRLAEQGLRIVARPYANFLPLPDGRALRLGGGLAESCREVARFSARDAERLPAYYATLERVAEVLRTLLLETPPHLGGGLFEALRAVRIGRRLGRLDLAGRRDALDLLTKSAGHWLDGWFESEPLKGALGFDAVVGNFASVYASGSAYVLLHHCLGALDGRPGQWGHAIGGMGAITQAMARTAASLGVDILTEAPVARILTRAGRAVGAVLADGREFQARAVVSNLNPRLTFLELLEPGELDPDFVRRIQNWRCASGSFRINLALAELPDFRAAPGMAVQDHHRSGILLAPSLDYLERAYWDARTQGWAREPVIEMLLPSTVDASLAPPGRHVASLFCQHFNPQLPDGGDWDAVKEQVADQIIATVGRYAPNFEAAVLGRQILSPLDLERTFGLTGGDIFHGALSLDQLYSARPVLGHADYRTPVAGLYLCGSGTHPGGGVSGIPGHNAAREILRDWRRRKRRGSW